MLTLTEEHLNALDPGDLAAFAARHAWIKDAMKRGGKQIPDDSDPSWNITLFRAGRGFGKRIEIYTPIPTPNGWTTMADIQPGQQVFDEYGRPCNVTFVSEIGLPERAYRLRFSDGTYLDADGEHQWVTWTHAERKAFLRSPYEDTRNFPPNWPQWRLKRKVSGFGEPHAYPDSPGPQIRTTDDIAATLTYGKRQDTNHCIPVTLPLDLPDADLPIDPYILGYWLGNGTAANGGLTIGSKDGDFDHSFIKQQVERAELPFSESFEYDRGQTGIRLLGFTKILRDNNLLQNKHIPTPYLRASSAQRLALLRGLMDSDGHADTSKVEFCTTDKRLLDGFMELARSLGQKPTFYHDRARLNGVDYGDRYRATWRPTINPFCLPRKAKIVPAHGGSQSLRNLHRMIVACDPIEPVPMRCISVDSPNSMYLAGEGMIPTHNTKSLTEWLWWELWQYPNLVGHCVAPTLSDIRGTLFEGPAGFCNVIPTDCLKGGNVDTAYNKSLHELKLANGSLIRGFGALDAGSRLRGPQCHVMVCDEIAQWDRPAGNLEETMDNALFGLRLKHPGGKPARAVMATTPLPKPFLKNLEKRPGVKVITGSTYENLDNLSPTIRAQLMERAGTLIGKQEIEGLYIDDEADLSIIKRPWIKMWPAGKPFPKFDFVVESYDCAATEHNYDMKKQTSDPTASIVLGVFDAFKVFTQPELDRLGVKSRFAALLLDCWAERLGMPALLDKARNQHAQKYGTPPRRSDLVIIEDKSSGPALRQFLVRYGVPTYAYNPGRNDKVYRLHAISPLLHQGMLFVPESDQASKKGQPMGWADEFINQLCSYYGPGTTDHDDYVDTVSSAYAVMRDRHILESTPATEFATREDKIDHDRSRASAYRRQTKLRPIQNPYG